LRKIRERRSLLFSPIRAPADGEGHDSRLKRGRRPLLKAAMAAAPGF
jgi:hypothetical protein